MNSENYDKIYQRLEFIRNLLSGTDLSLMITNEPDNNEHKSNNIKDVLNKDSKSFKDIIHQIGGKLLYIKSGTTGHTFKGIIFKDKLQINYAVKVVAYPKKENYGEITDLDRPENAELMMLKTLSYFVINNQTPHIVLPIATFNTNIKMFLNLNKNNIVVNKKYDQFIKRYEDDELHEHVSVLISEWADAGDLLDYLRNNFKELKLREWRVILFQLLSVLAVIQTKYPNFRHNDLKANNILLQKINNNDNNHIYKYNINNNEYYVPNIGMRIKIWDFDFACIPGIVDNAKVSASWTNKINVKPDGHLYYDIHYFFNTLVSKNFIPDLFSKDESGKTYVPQEIIEFIDRVVPLKLRHGKTVTERGRLLLSYAQLSSKCPELIYKTADDIIKHDTLFKKMRPN
jgi:serine/threonine protein kinase